MSPCTPVSIPAKNHLVAHTVLACVTEQTHDIRVYGLGVGAIFAVL